MINKRLSNEEEEELMDALAPDYSDYMYYKAKEWANIDGTGLEDREQYLDSYWYDWCDIGEIDEWEEMLEWDWDDTYEHNHSIRVKEYLK